MRPSSSSLFECRRSEQVAHCLLSYEAAQCFCLSFVAAMLRDRRASSLFKRLFTPAASGHKAIAVSRASFWSPKSEKTGAGIFRSPPRCDIHDDADVDELISPSTFSTFTRRDELGTRPSPRHDHPTVRHHSGILTPPIAGD